MSKREECPFIETCDKKQGEIDYKLWCVRSHKTCSKYKQLANIEVDNRVMLPKKWKAEQNA